MDRLLDSIHALVLSSDVLGRAWEGCNEIKTVFRCLIHWRFPAWTVLSFGGWENVSASRIDAYKRKREDSYMIRH
jgi:hypothetical protein